MEKYDASQLISLIRENRVIAIVRHLPGDQLLPVFESLYAGGVRLIEVTMNTAGAASQIAEARVYRAQALLALGRNTEALAEADKGLALQTMRSLTYVLPGQTLSCVGCHEEKNSAPPVYAAGATLALRAGPQALEPFYGPPRGFSYAREVQPVVGEHHPDAVHRLAADRERHE